MAEHSGWSASGFEAMMLCPGKKVMEQGLPSYANSYSAEGTVAHLVLTWALREQRDAAAYIGRVVHLDELGNVCEPVAAKFTFEVTDDMAEDVQVTIDYVRQVAGDDVVWVDTRVDYSHALDLPEGEAWGTLDVAIIKSDGELIVLDLKFGRGVEVSAGQDVQAPEGPVVDRHPNPQMALYALGALRRVEEILGEKLTRVRLVISQPRVSHRPSEYDLPVEALEAWARTTARSAVNSVKNALDYDDGPFEDFMGIFLSPSEKACRFCRAKATCPALREAALSTVYTGGVAAPEDFDQAPSDKAVLASVSVADRDWLDAVFPKLEMIEDWAKAVLAEIERRALAGETFKNVKVVKGKKGNRSWDNPDEVAAYLKDTVRLTTEQLYTLKLKSPTQIEKLAPKFDKDGKPVPVAEGAEAPPIGPRQWAKLKTRVTQAEGRLHIAPIDDARPAVPVTPASDDFESQPTSVTAEDLA